MTPNLRSLVAKAYRFRQGRTFSSSSSSSSPNTIGEKGKGLDYMPFLDTVGSIGCWLLAGYAVEFCWEISVFYKSKQKSDELWELYKREIKLYHEEVDRSIRELSEE